MTSRRVDLVLLVIGVAILWAAPHGIGADGEIRVQALSALLHGHLAAPRYSIVGPLFATPLHLVGATAFYNVALFTLFLGFLWREVRDVRLLVLLVYASMFPNHVGAFYGEPFTAIAATAGIVLLTRTSRSRSRPPAPRDPSEPHEPRDRRAAHRVAGFALLVLAAVNTPPAVLGVAGVALYEARRLRRHAPLVAPVVVIALVLLENTLMRGHPFSSGYAGDAGFATVMPYSGKPGFSYPLFFGVLAIFLSFGKGLVFFAPGLFVPPAPDADPRLRRMRVLLVVFVAGLVFAYAKWWSWYGGLFWGPRFFLIASVPACLTLYTHLASPRTRAATTTSETAETPAPAAATSSSFASRGPLVNAVVATALLLSFWVGVNGLAFDMTGLGICSANDYALESLCHFTPEFSPLWFPFTIAAPSPRPLAVVVTIFWAGVLVWTSRAIFARLLADLSRSIRRPPR